MKENIDLTLNRVFRDKTNNNSIIDPNNLTENFLFQRIGSIKKNKLWFYNRKTSFQKQFFKFHKIKKEVEGEYYCKCGKKLHLWDKVNLQCHECETTYNSYRSQKWRFNLVEQYYF